MPSHKPEDLFSITWTPRHINYRVITAKCLEVYWPPTSDCGRFKWAPRYRLSERALRNGLWDAARIGKLPPRVMALIYPSPGKWLAPSTPSHLAEGHRRVSAPSVCQVPTDGHSYQSVWAQWGCSAICWCFMGICRYLCIYLSSRWGERTRHWCYPQDRKSFRCFYLCQSGFCSALTPEQERLQAFLVSPVCFPKHHVSGLNALIQQKCSGCTLRAIGG